MQQPDIPIRAVRSYASGYWQAHVSGDCDCLTRSTEPKPGYYRARVSEHGPWQAVQVWSEIRTDVSFERVFAEADGLPIKPEIIWEKCEPITHEQWQTLLTSRMGSK